MVLECVHIQPKEAGIMANQSEASDDLRWLIEPPESGEVRFYIATGEGLEVTDSVRQALDRLMRALQGPTEAQGYAAGQLPPMASCLPDLTCGALNAGCSPRDRCIKLSQHPCAAEVSCVIKPK
jgi:hypothetical protein